MLNTMSVLVFWLPLFVICNINGQTHQQQGVHLSISGTTIIANNSYMNFYDMIQNDLDLICHTNKANCCRDNMLGDWFYPNGTIVESYTVYKSRNISEFFSRFRNRTQSSVSLTTGDILGLQVYVGPPERGHFYCKIPDANDVNQTIYVNILDIGIVTVTPLIYTNFGQIFSIVCSVDIFSDIEELAAPPPTFEWFFGPNATASLPSGVAVSSVTNNGTTYTSTLFFIPLKVFHTGMYTCRLGSNPRLEAYTKISVKTVDRDTLSLVGVTSQTSLSETGAHDNELFYSIIALCVVILIAILASATAIIGLIMRLPVGTPSTSDREADILTTQCEAYEALKLQEVPQGHTHTDTGVPEEET